MTGFALFIRNVRYYGRQWLLLVLGALLVATVMSTALYLGDSVECTLRRSVERRLAGLRSVAQWDGVRPVPGAFLHTRGFVQAADGRARAIEVYGIEDAAAGLADREAMANQALLDFLGGASAAFTGEVVVRVQTMPEIDAESMPGRPGRIRQLRVNVQGLLPLPYRDFSLEDSQNVPLNLFLRRSYLANSLECVDGGNLVISEKSADDLRRELQDALRPEDIGLYFADMGGRPILKSRRYFLPEFLAMAFPAAQPVLSWFFAELTDDAASVVYSFIAGVPEELMPIPATECWLSEQLGLQPGTGPAQLRYFQVGAFRDITLNDASFARLRLVDDRAITRSLSADIPGLTDAASCSHWDAPLPVDLKRIRDDDEVYWREHGAKPKAYIALSRAQELFGANALSGLLFPAGADVTTLDAQLSSLLRAESGLLHCFEPREESLANALAGVDFASLFLGLSSLVMVSALLVLVLLLRLHLLERQGESELFAALGFPANWLRRELALELGLALVLGSALGVLAGMGVSALLLRALGWVWGDVYGLSRMLWCCELASAVGALAVSSLLGLGALLVLLWRQGRPVFWRRQWSRQLSGIADLAWRTVWRRQSQSRPLVALLTLGITLTLAVGANAIRTRGEEGFGYQWVLSTALPYTGLLPGQDSGAVLPIRVHLASPADCGNLSRVSTPNVFGVSLDGLGKDAPTLTPNGAAVDRGVLQWILKARLGDTLDYVGGSVVLEHAFAGSVFQGGIVVGADSYQRLFPDEQGAAMWLLRADADLPALTAALADYGVSLESCRERMARFDDIQNRYLLLFLALGLLALLLGVGAMALALARAMEERRDEIILLAEMGFANHRIAAIFFVEQLILLGAGLVLSLILLGALSLFSALSLSLVFLVLTLLLLLWVAGLALEVLSLLRRMTSHLS